MGSCKFTNELNRLRKSSNDSIDNVEKFDEFKKYMHVTRAAEEDLKSILRAVNVSNKKSLILLCGSAGDGKSHLLSYLRNSDEEQLIENYTVFNDATESSSPSMTAIQTLNVLLDDFRDSKLEMAGKNIILAINLGVLSNFIESEYGNDFSTLKKYVENSNILTSQVNINGYDSNSYFQHVSFSDYHMYSLKEEGIHAGYIEDILEKIFTLDDKNIFYQSYQNYCVTCPLAQKCPVKNNYEYMMDLKRQKYVAELLVKVTIQDKVILTTREILNFIYDILVAQNFSFTKYQKLIVDDTLYLKEYIKHITPKLLFDSTDVTTLMNLMKKYDPLLQRTESEDALAISYYVSANISKEIKLAISDLPFGNILCNDSMIKRINSDRTLKSMIFNIMVRCQFIDDDKHHDKIYEQYLKDLYWFNAGKGEKLEPLYVMVERGIEQWCGSDGDGNLCLKESRSEFSIFETIKFKEVISHIPKPKETEELQKFITSITAAFKDDDGGKILLDIDFSLYELIYRLNQGYIQTAEDRNNHADFISFINHILQTGSLTESLSIVSANGKKAIISRGMFGNKYKFKVVK